jgi:DNA-damage-inducible protein D
MLFDTIKHINGYGQEFWKARELAKVLQYRDFGNFDRVINKAKTTCESSWQPVSDHFGEITEMVDIWSGSKRVFSSYQLSRYACYLIAMEADGSKTEVWLAKTYFALQTRKQELDEESIEDQKRIYLREQVSKNNKSLAKIARKAWVVNYGNFVDYWYLGLYGMRNKEILKKKWLAPKTSLMDTVGSEELAANLFRATQTEAKIKRESLYGQQQTENAHLEVGKDVRETIKKIGGTMPEDLPPADDIKEAKKRIKIKQNKLK